MLKTPKTLILVATAISALATVPAAHAGTATATHGGNSQMDLIHFVDPADEPIEGNRVTVGAVDNVALRLVDNGADITPSTNCSLDPGTFRSVTCFMNLKGLAVNLEGNEGSDVLAIGASLRQHMPNGYTFLFGGSGNDRLVDTTAPGELQGGEGDDILRPGLGNDIVGGGTGNDLIDYAERTQPVTVDLTTTAKVAGQAGEGDSLTSIEWVSGGSAADTIVGNDKDNEINGRAGADAIGAGGGNDLIEARDSTKDTISCGTGTDTVYVDQADVVADDCETVKTSGVLPISAAVPPAPPADPGTPPAPAPGPGTSPEPGTTPGPGTPVDPGTGLPQDAPAADTTRPVVTRFRGAPSSFRAGSGARRGTELLFNLSETARRVEIGVDRVLPGRRVGTACRKPTRRLRTRRACSRHAAIGMFTRGPVGTGLVSIRWTGRVRGATLRPGAYRLTVVAVDAAGNRSLPKRVRVQIKRPAR